MKKVFWMCLSCFLLFKCFSTERINKKMTLDLLLEKHSKAIGGIAAMEHVRSMKTALKLEIEGEFIEGTVYYKLPDKFATVMKMKEGDFWQIYDGERGIIGFKDNFEIVSDSIAIQFKRGASIFQLYNIKKRDWTLEYMGTELLDKNTYYILVCSEKEYGVSYKYFINPKSYLIARMETNVGSEVNFKDYRTIHGFSYPFKGETNTEGLKINYYITNIIINPKLDDSFFATKDYLGIKN